MVNAAKVASRIWQTDAKFRSNLRSGELSLNIFAADVYDVGMAKSKSVYQDARSTLQSIRNHTDPSPASGDKPQGGMFNGKIVTSTLL